MCYFYWLTNYVYSWIYSIFFLNIKEIYGKDRYSNVYFDRNNYVFFYDFIWLYFKEFPHTVIYTGHQNLRQVNF